jgi:ribosomal protein S21
MSINVRVEARRLPLGAGRQERDKAIQSLLRALKRACNDAGVTQAYRDHEFFVRPCDIRRRKRMAKQRAPMEAELKAKEDAKEKKEKKDKKGFGKY